MKPAPFDYVCPDSVDEAVEILSNRGEDAKLMAGGQSLVPMLNFRVVRPGLVVDITRLLELDYVRPRSDGGLVLGALTRHRVLETSAVVAERFPIVPWAMKHVAHLAIRNRGTLGGSLSHADPAAELPMLVLLLDATIVARSVRGERAIVASEFFVGPLATALRDDEILTRVEWPALPAGMGWAFEEHARRPGDFALAAVAVLLSIEGDEVREIRIAMMGVGDTPLRCVRAEQLLRGRVLDPAVLVQAAEAAIADLEPRPDLHASPELRRHLARVLTERALHSAWRRAKGDPT